MSFTGANTSATAVVTIKGDAGNDTLIGSASKDTTTGGAGVDTIATGSGADVINGGLGNDIINSGAGLDSVTGGGGNDQFTIVANANGNIFAAIAEANTGDIIRFNGVIGQSFATTKLTLGSTAVFADYLNLASSGNVTLAAGTTAVSHFQFAGDTYVVADVSAATSFVNGADMVVKLTGIVDLSTAVISTATLTLG